MCFRGTSLGALAFVLTALASLSNPAPEVLPKVYLVEMFHPRLLVGEAFFLFAAGVVNIVINPRLHLQLNYHSLTTIVT